MRDDRVEGKDVPDVKRDAVDREVRENSGSSHDNISPEPQAA